MNRYLQWNGDFIIYKNTECTIKKRNNIDQTENKHLKYTSIIINNVSSLGWIERKICTISDNVRKKIFQIKIDLFWIPISYNI